MEVLNVKAACVKRLKFEKAFCVSEQLTLKNLWSWADPPRMTLCYADLCVYTVKSSFVVWGSGNKY